ncbi:MAG: M64 family metallopeptidase [Draconibacterium sp.]
MKRIIICLFLITPFLLNAQVQFNDYFTDHSLRFDFLLGGNANDVTVYPEGMKQEPFWAGNKNHLVDTFNYGTYRYRVFEQASDKLIFSKGFSTLFQEWQTTAEAKKTHKTFYQAAIFPFPKNKVRLEIDARQWDGSFKNLLSTEIDPKDYFIRKEQGEDLGVNTVLKNGDPGKKVDIVILAEGYTQNEKEKFFEDAKRVSDMLFEDEPFLSEKNNFNINAVFTPSQESGTDVPGENIYKNTRFNATFYTFDISRYLTTSDMKSIYDAASVVPYDHLYVLVNTTRYGGGGFYNFLTLCTADNDRTKQVFIHEFGHGFAGLGDEYYSSSVAYEDFYNLKIEPWEPNLTTLVDFDQKWKSMVEKPTPVPTPREAKYSKTVGVYEGGGYLSKGIYSPYIDCRMKSNEAKDFCPVCQEAIRKVIRAHVE